MTHPEVAMLVSAIDECSKLGTDELHQTFTQEVASRYDEKEFAHMLDRVAKAMHQWWSA